MTGVGATITPVAADTDCTGLPLSVTVAVNAKVPLAVGVPEMVPVVDVSISPEGRLPDVIDHEYGAAPPIACNVCEYAAPAVAGISAGVAMDSGVLATVMETGADIVCAGLLLSLTAAVKVITQLAVGVPEIMPVGASVSPTGRLPDAIDHL